jgi:hypothetical protein
VNAAGRSADGRRAACAAAAGFPGVRLALAAFALAMTGRAAPSGDAAAPAAENRLNFSLLPKAFQKKADVHLTVITEMTIDGSKARQPTAARPMYYLPHSIGYHDEGDSYGEKRILPVDKLQDMIEKALADNHFLPADAAHPAALVIFFSWGSADKLDNRAGAAFDDGADVPLDVVSADFITRQNFLARAQLVGGIMFATKVGNALKQDDTTKLLAIPMPGISQFELLQDREPLVRQLLEQAMDDCYYVVASAYDALAMAHGQRRMMWQTKMTTNSAGVSMVETLPSLIESGAPYFGRAMSQPTILERHFDREGRVEVGTPRVLPDLPAPAPAAAK